MQSKVQFFEKYDNGIRCRGFVNESNEQTTGEIMLKIFEISEQIRKQYIEEGRAQ